jgi:hypothetical protein
MPFILLYWRQILAGLGIITILASCAYIRHVFNQRAYYEQAYKEKTLEMARMEAGFKAYISLNEDIQNDLRLQKKKLRDRISEIENADPPVDGTRFVFMQSSSVRAKTATTNK